MTSIEKESVPFRNVIDTNKARGSVEKWLVEVEERLFESTHRQTRLGLEDYSSKPRHEWVLQWQGMMVLVVTGMFWTKGVEDALGTQDIKVRPLCSSNSLDFREWQYY
jgi:dynein heavy chain